DGLATQSLFRLDAAPFDEEHSLEIQLPLLQRTLPAALVVPVLLGELVGDDTAVLAGTLRQLFDPQTLFVVSSDFVHYGRRFGSLPFPSSDATSVRTALRRLDMGAIEYVCRGDAAGFRRYIAETGATICGRTPIAAFLTAHDRRTPG